MEEIISCCGVVCSKCQSYPMECKGCPASKGKAYWLTYTNEEICSIYECCVNRKQLRHCGKCEKLPCIHYDGSDPTKTMEENESDFVSQLAQLHLMNQNDS